MIVSGKEVFKLVDSIGLPLDIVNLQLQEDGNAFNVAEFIESAKEAGWKKDRVYNMILYSGNQSNNTNFKDKLELFINYYYKEINE